MQQDPDKAMLDLIASEFDGDPTGIILDARHPLPVPPAPPLTDTTSPASENKEVTPPSGGDDLREPTQAEREASALSVNKQGEIDWSKSAANFAAAYDHANGAIFSWIADADIDQREDFQMDDRDMESFINAMTPVAEKYKWNFGPEYTLAIVMIDILQRNFRHAMTMRKVNKRAKLAEAKNEALEDEIAQLKRDKMTAQPKKD